MSQGVATHSLANEYYVQKQSVFQAIYDDHKHQDNFSDWGIAQQPTHTLVYSLQDVFENKHQETPATNALHLLIAHQNW